MYGRREGKRQRKEASKEESKEAAVKLTQNGTERAKKVKSARKGCGYQARCWTCGRIGHKSAECNVFMFGDVEQEAGVGSV